MTEQLGVGIIGCGNISAAYMRLAPMYKSIKVLACADLNPAASAARAAEFGLRDLTIDELLAADDIDIVVNLTIPAAHFEVSKRILEAGKHSYSEKPFVLSVDEGKKLAEIARARNLYVGSAPDTFLGGAHQLARHLIDQGEIGKVIAGSCHVMSHGMEDWHPNPDFFFQPGGGPVLDLAPYYITNLVNIIGPVKRVAALASKGSDTRTIGSGDRKGEQVPVDTPTNIHALLEFENGATITMSNSWDVWAHRHANMELYGAEGSLFVPDPNFFGGEVEMAKSDGEIKPVEMWAHPFAKPNEDENANYRTVGLADMADAIIKGRDYRCSLNLALHVVDVMLGVLRSGEIGQFVAMTTTCERPEALSPEAAKALMA
ncbi:Gfo/Idh/MocA family protein [Maritalea mediterranea]|uniref:Gfo/Idh/MocA family oxidoreductase n=1 Tax=Maritalea mediterranea TaxID=2909667 RepID=A0ABS9E7I7_9HYPH|nr:Gfo/Idh/MocA family oxidoreductase [Maritalea mediterranea]MCF4098139.1 Gfo/Idh/MocA family oxidoreductase [Maritalea mediterranea]